MLNDTKLKWQRFFSDEACYEQIFTRIEEIAINEVVELAKRYADDSAPVFINGILASVIKLFF